ncbi:MAG TPA: FxLYD domain-containing protein [Candidatus Tectomicrobia bacterium]|nr:FxLYD domain-containing protein [Candidatus Tectomicrobia bacterium]
MVRLVLAVLLVVVAATIARGQEGFRVTYEVDARSRPDQTRLSGRVVNERNSDVLDVSVTAEALDARGRVLARGIAFVDARIGGGESRPFVAVVPAVPGVARYRVRVSSYRTGLTDQQGP